MSLTFCLVSIKVLTNAECAVMAITSEISDPGLSAKVAAVQRGTEEISGC